MSSLAGTSTAALRDAPEGDGARRRIIEQFEQGAGALAARMLATFRSGIPTYDTLPEETLRQVRDVVQDNLTCFTRCMRRGADPSPGELAVFRDSASRRAREGVALSAVLEAYRAGARIAWETLRGIAEAAGEPGIGLELATQVMSYVDGVSGAVAEAYIGEFESLASDREAARRDFLDALLEGSLTSEELVARGEALGLDPANPYVVCLVRLADDADDQAARADHRRLRTMVAALAAGERTLVVNRGQEVLTVVPARVGAEQAVADRLRRFVTEARESLGQPLTAGMGRIHEDLSELAGAYREAAVALTAARGGVQPVAVYGQVLLEELLLREPSIARRLAATVLDPLRPHPYLTDTLRAFLRHGPSLPEVATELCVHPNTVAYRLGRIRELSGHDPRSPAGIAQLAIALRAAELLDA